MFSFEARRLIAAATVFTLVRHVHCSENAPRIAVVGAGIGGASAVYYLKSLFENTGPTINVYESKRIGGRLATTLINNREYEVGGSVIHPKNQYMTEFTKLTGLTKRTPQSDNGRMGLYDGKHYVFTDSSWQFINLIKMLWRYGISVLKWEKLMDDTMSTFSKIYGIQDNGLAFTSPDKLLAAMSPSFRTLTQTTIQQHLQNQKFTELFINELVMAITRVNYGQTTDINGFVGEVALAGAGPDLWSVSGGNHLVAERLLQNTSSEIIFERVIEVVYQKSENTFLVVSTSANLDANMNEVAAHSKRQEEYDMIIIATPLIDGVSDIKFTGFSQPIVNFKGSYQRTVATIVDGEVNKTYLNMGGYDLDSILTTSTQVEFNSLSRISPVENGESEDDNSGVWKVFSQNPLTEKQLNKIFVARYDTQVIDWLAYPHYTPPEQLQSFVLHPDLPIFYTSAIEWAASAMEMSCIAGRNAALLAHHFWFQNHNKIDKMPHSRGTRSEL